VIHIVSPSDVQYGGHDSGRNRCDTAQKSEEKRCNPAHFEFVSKVVHLSFPFQEAGRMRPFWKAMLSQYSRTSPAFDGVDVGEPTICQNDRAAG
jgi:hypothetical protein